MARWRVKWDADPRDPRASDWWELNGVITSATTLLKNQGWVGRRHRELVGHLNNHNYDRISQVNDEVVPLSVKFHQQLKDCVDSVLQSIAEKHMNIDFKIAEPIPGKHVLTYPDDSCRPASEEEVKLWAVLNRTQADNASKNGTIKALGKQISQLTSKNKALSKRVDPSEVERLRADKEKWASNCLKVIKKAAELEGQLEATTQRADAAERKLVNQRDFVMALEAFEADGETFVRRYDVLDALLSASAEPAGLWIKCSDQLPDVNAHVLVAAEFFGPGDWRIKVGGIDENGDWTVFGASWTPTRWMPMPAGPSNEAPAKPVTCDRAHGGGQCQDPACWVGIGNPPEYVLSVDSPELFQELLDQAKANNGE